MKGGHGRMLRTMAADSVQWLMKHWLGQGRGIVVEIVIVDEFVIVDVGCTTASMEHGCKICQLTNLNTCAASMTDHEHNLVGFTVI